MIKIYGCSGDYVIIKGDNYAEQVDLRFGEPLRCVFADGTMFTIAYARQDAGTWDVTDLVAGDKFIRLIKSEGEYSREYSDIIELEECDCLAPKLMKS